MEFTQLLEAINDALDQQFMTAEQVIETLVVRLDQQQLQSVNAEIVAIQYNNLFQPVDS